MAATQADIRRWFDNGVENGATHMIVICDTWDHDDFPTYVPKGKDPREYQREYLETHGSMFRVMEVYNLSMDREHQLNQFRAFNY